MDNIRLSDMNLNELIQYETTYPLVKESDVSVKSPVKSADENRAESKHNTPSNDTSASDAVKVDISPIWKEAAGQINLKNATSDEVAALSSKLFKANVITFEDHVNLSFQDTPENQKINVLDHWQHRQEKATYQGASRDELNDIVRIQSILGYVDSLNN